MWSPLASYAVATANETLKNYVHYDAYLGFITKHILRAFRLLESTDTSFAGFRDFC